jgi:group I intron endonuclease
MEGYIYCITNNINNKVYIGQTRQTVRRRFMCHIWEAERVDDLSDTKLNRAILKYGRDNFNVEEIHKCTIEEIYYIQKYDSYRNGYNSTLGGSGALGTARTDEIKQKIREFQIEYNKNPEIRANKSVQMTGESHPQYNKLGENSPNFGIIRETTKNNYQTINEIRTKKANGELTSELAKIYNKSIKTINNYCGPDFEHLGSPSTTNCSIRRQVSNRTKRTLESRNIIQIEESSPSKSKECVAYVTKIHISQLNP